WSSISTAGDSRAQRRAGPWPAGFMCGAGALKSRIGAVRMARQVGPDRRSCKASGGLEACTVGITAQAAVHSESDAIRFRTIQHAINEEVMQRLKVEVIINYRCPVQRVREHW